MAGARSAIVFFYFLNLMKTDKIFILALIAAVSLAGCSRGAKITVTGNSGSDIVVKALAVNKYTVLDTLNLGKSGKAVCKVALEKGQPEFIYLYAGQKKVASLLLDRGDKVDVVLDTIGGYSVSGSDDCVRLQKIDADFKAVSEQMSDLSYDLDRAVTDAEISHAKRDLGQAYVDYYRSAVKYVLENSHSLTVVPVFWQSFTGELPVFGQETDGILMLNVADSLETVYPKSKYVKALRDEAKRRMDYMSLLNNLRNAEPVSFLDVDLPDINARKVKLSEVNAPLVMLHFWTASDPEQCRFNLDVLKHFYDKYHSRGLEIYSVALDLDKTLWAKVVKEQNLPWINVCDSQGANSKYIGQYNITKLPTSYFISHGELVDAKVTDEKSLDELLGKLLK